MQAVEPAQFIEIDLGQLVEQAFPASFSNTFPPAKNVFVSRLYGRVYDPLFIGMGVSDNRHCVPSESPQVFANQFLFERVRSSGKRHDGFLQSLRIDVLLEERVEDGKQLLAVDLHQPDGAV